MRSNCRSNPSAVRAGFLTWRSSPIKTKFSLAVNTSSTAANCPVRLIWFRTSSACVATSNPFTVAVPMSASRSVVKILIVVVLPEPLAPSSAKMVPFSTMNETSRSTCTFLYDFCNSLAVIAVGRFSITTPCFFKSAYFSCKLAHSSWVISARAGKSPYGANALSKNS